jgi:hypothetical protein
MEQSEHVGIHLLEDPISILNSKVKHKVTSMKQKGGYSNTCEQYPNRTRLLELEKVARQESVVNGSLNYLCRSIISSAGKVYHPDPEIQEFTDKNLNYLQEKSGTDDWTGIVEELLYTTLWSGMAVGEKLFKKVNDQLVLDDVAIYHPNTIFIVPNKKFSSFSCI